MNVFTRIALLSFYLLCSTSVYAGVTPVDEGFQVSYTVNLKPGTSNGNDIIDIFIFEWSKNGELSVDRGYMAASGEKTLLSHVIGFEPDRSFVMGWGAGSAGIGDEKDHIFTLANHSFTRQMTGKKWSEAFPGVSPAPRTGHSAMIQLVKDAADGDADALSSVSEWVEREAVSAAFNPKGRFRVMEWSVGFPIDPVAPIPAITPFGVFLMILGLLALVTVQARKGTLTFSRNQ